MLAPCGRKIVTTLGSIWESQDFTNKDPCSQNYGFSSSHVWMWELEHKESWTTKNWCFQIVVLEKILESPLDSKELKLGNPKGNQSWIFTERTDAEAKAPILWPPNGRVSSLEKILMLGKLEVKENSSREWDGWMASSTRWTWIWANSGRQRRREAWRAEFMGSQRIEHNSVTEQ